MIIRMHELNYEYKFFYFIFVNNIKYQIQFFLFFLCYLLLRTFLTSIFTNYIIYLIKLMKSAILISTLQYMGGGMGATWYNHCNWITMWIENVLQRDFHYKLKNICEYSGILLDPDADSLPTELPSSSL